MTLEEFAQEKASLLVKKPTPDNIYRVVNDIVNLEVNKHPITSSQINQILSYMEDQIADFSPILESFDNTATLSLMAQVRKLIAQAQK